MLSVQEVRKDSSAVCRDMEGCVRKNVGAFHGPSGNGRCPDPLPALRPPPALLHLLAKPTWDFQRTSLVPLLQPPSREGHAWIFTLLLHLPRALTPTASVAREWDQSLGTLYTLEPSAAFSPPPASSDIWASPGIASLFGSAPALSHSLLLPKSSWNHICKLLAPQILVQSSTWETSGPQAVPTKTGTLETSPPPPKPSCMLRNCTSNNTQ